MDNGIVVCMYSYFYKILIIIILYINEQIRGFFLE